MRSEPGAMLHEAAFSAFLALTATRLAFPSLHCAVTAFILGFDAAWGSRRRAAWCAIPVAALWVSTLALRFHYAADVLAGFVLAALCLALSAALLRARRSARPALSA